MGEVLGKYPHGDTAVYDALVRMAQDFSVRAPLIDGHGNLARWITTRRGHAIHRIASAGPHEGSLLEDIESETVDFIDNFDGSQREPTVLPARVPQLLLNGSAGIAVGMATNIPPTTGELIEGVLALIANPEIEPVRQIIPG